MAVSLSSMAAVLRPGARGVKKKKKAEEAAARVREWLPITPKGSWERISDLVSNAARRDPQFGGNSEQSCWFISIWASFPEKKAVVIANSDTGKLFLARYAIDDDENVTFPTVKDAQSSVTVAESLRRVREMKRPQRRRAIAEAAKATNLSESLKFDVRIREMQVDDNGARAICVMLEEGPGNAVDGHYYLDECMESAAAVFEGAQSFADHADELEEKLRPGRSIRDLIGWWSDVHVEEDGGKKLLVGTFNIESGNDFALNKMREAKRYRERYADQPEKQYVGFSISAGGVSESRQIGGKAYNAVLRITEAGSTDMVTRAGAGGKMLSLKEAQQMGNPDTSALADAIAKKLHEAAKSSGVTIPVTTSLVESAAKAAGLELDEKQVKALTSAIAEAAKKKNPFATEAGDADATDVSEDDDADDDDDIDDVLDALPAKRPKESAQAVPVAEGATPADAKLLAENARLLTENAKLTNAATFGALKETAKAIVRELKVPKAAQAYVFGELLECEDADAMRERGNALLEGVIRPIHGDGVVGVAARMREQASTGLLDVSGIAG